MHQKHYLKQITWKFSDGSTNYPELKKGQPLLRTPEDAYSNFRFLFAGQVRERFVVFWLDSMNRVLGFEIITEGTLNASLAHPREVFRGAIVATCASVIVAHNHPSGNPEPSTEDVQLTKQLIEAGRIIGIPVLDHIIFANDRFTSLAERGSM